MSRSTRQISVKLNRATSFDKVKKELDTLKELSHFFLEAEKHHQREEEAVFPRLIAHGVTEPPEIFNPNRALGMDEDG